MTTSREICNEIGNSFKKLGATLEEWEISNREGMAQFEVQLATFKTEMEKLAEPTQDAPGNETLPSLPSGPDSPATASPAPKQPAFGVSAHVSLLADAALVEAGKLPGDSANAVINRIKEIQQAKDNEAASLAVVSALGEAQMLWDHDGIDPTELVKALMKIQVIVGGGGGTLVGGTDAAGDIVG